MHQYLRHDDALVFIKFHHLIKQWTEKNVQIEMKMDILCFICAQSVFSETLFDRIWAEAAAGYQKKNTRQSSIYTEEEKNLRIMRGLRNKRQRCSRVH